MADICMCQDKKCPSRILCYRFTAEKDPYRQTYFAKSPRNPHAMRCESFWSNEGTPDPADDSVSSYNPPVCRCDAMAMPHKYNPICQLHEIVSQNQPQIRDKKGKNVRKNRKG